MLTTGLGRSRWKPLGRFGGGVAGVDRHRRSFRRSVLGVSSVTGRVQSLAFLFTDIEGSTNLLRHLGVRYRAVLLDHRSLLTTAFEQFGGRLLGSEGDSLFAAFSNPEDALLAAAECQLLLGEATWPDDIALKVRMGIHIGDVTVEEDEYVGLAIHQAARISNAAHGNQILVSEAT